KVNLKNYEQCVHDDIPKGDSITGHLAEPRYSDAKVDNILKIVENKNSVDTEILTEMNASNAKLNQYTKFDQWNLAYDPNGNTTQKGSQQFAYNYRNQLVKATEDSKTTTFGYDAFGRRFFKEHFNGSTSQRFNYFYAGNQVIEERNGTDQVTKQYVYGNGIDELLRLDIYSGATSTPYYLHTNDIGSTTAITDSTGALIERISYDTFGLPSFSDADGQSIGASSISNTTLFQGREYDQELNLYNYRARYYDPIMSRFLQTDPIGYRDSMNLYQGMNMNTENFVDPLGKEYFVFNADRSRVSIYLNRESENIVTTPPIANNVLLDQVPEQYRNNINYLANRSDYSSKEINFIDRNGGESADGYNATAQAYASEGGGRISFKTFDARTYASSGNPKIKNDTYFGQWTMHRGNYRAIRLKKFNPRNPNRHNLDQRGHLQGSYDDRIPIVGMHSTFTNQNYFADAFNLSNMGYSGDVGWWANTIDIHHSGANDNTGFTLAENPISAGCLLIRNSEWDEFNQLIDIQHEDIIIIEVNTEINR
ncbi:MAG: RHS repeat-associated core domain-containing protein, partial [Thermodesulfovibrionales bacterium]|nr:RHS repeat-associated core domain-containing protein [Thermodesulfovibrionales bacterium]